MSRIRSTRVRVALVVAGLAGAVGVATAAPLTAAATVAAPGTVVSVGQLPAGGVPAGAQVAATVRYTSTGVGGRPVVVGGRVFAPGFAPPAGGYPVVSLTHGTTGLGPACAPSGSPGIDTNDNPMISGLLRQGYAVVATDYAEMGNPPVQPYLDGDVEAYGAIDIVRAMHSLAPGLFAKRWAVYGGSQGGHAALFTGNLATHYAPELDFRGTAAIAPPSNLSPIIAKFTPQTSILSGDLLFVADIFASIEVVNPGFPMASYLSPQGVAVVQDATTMCNNALAAQTSGMTIGQLLAKPLDAAFEQAMSAQFDVPTSGYTQPVFIGQGDADQTVPVFLTTELVNQLTAANQPVTYKIYPGQDHVPSMTASLPDVLAFLRPLLGP
jgi:acetyl esterase/lipase